MGVGKGLISKEALGMEIEEAGGMELGERVEDIGDGETDDEGPRLPLSSPLCQLGRPRPTAAWRELVGQRCTYTGSGRHEFEGPGRRWWAVLFGPLGI